MYFPDRLLTSWADGVNEPSWVAYIGRRSQRRSGSPGKWRKEETMRTESRPNSDYTRTWSPSGEVEYAKLADGTRLRYLKVGSGPAALILLHTVRTRLDHFQLVIPKIVSGAQIHPVAKEGLGVRSRP